MKLELCDSQVPQNQKGSVILQLSDVPEFLLHLQCCLTSGDIKKCYHGELFKHSCTASIVQDTDCERTMAIGPNNQELS